MRSLGCCASLLANLVILSGFVAIAAPSPMPESLARLSRQLQRHELTELRVYSLLPSPEGGSLAIFETVPDERYVVRHPGLTCRDGVTARMTQNLSAAILQTAFTAESQRYAVDFVLQFYDENGRKRFSLLMGTGQGAGFGRNSDPWHVELNGQSFLADGPVRSWLKSNYPHPGCTRFDLGSRRARSHG